MNNIVVIGAAIAALLVIFLIVFSLFAIGFFIGFYFEEKRVIKKTHIKEEKENYESEEEKKSKREWKKFLNYDGSAPYGASED